MPPAGMSAIPLRISKLPLSTFRASSTAPDADGPFQSGIPKPDQRTPPTTQNNSLAAPKQTQLKKSKKRQPGASAPGRNEPFHSLPLLQMPRSPNPGLLHKPGAGGSFQSGIHNPTGACAEPFPSAQSTPHTPPFQPNPNQFPPAADNSSIRSACGERASRAHCSGVLPFASADQSAPDEFSNRT